MMSVHDLPQKPIDCYTDEELQAACEWAEGMTGITGSWLSAMIFDEKKKREEEDLC